ncbi:uncharacterized protein [Haliotis cracherodii]|uniref:uncharacterized protein n=1 Tax=Haliotis cracherodii TaxID=6455 RepID=UPI0039EBF4FC
MASILSVALICACVLVCSGAVYDQYPYRGQKSDVYPGGRYPGYPNQDSWPRFIVIASVDETPLKLNPFAISKGIQSTCGEVKNVTRLRSGSILVECARRQQSINLLGLQQFVNTQVAVSVHRTLNSSRGIVRDRARCLSEMTEEEIAAELKHQGVTAVKRFTRKTEDGNILKTQTYLFTFSTPTVPSSIKAGYFNIGVEVYVPNPLRCFKCQHFGHGAKSCTAKTRCSRCSGPHEGTECTNEIKCANCSGYRRSVPSYDDGSYPRHYPYYPTGYPYYPKYPTQKDY